MQKWIGLLLTLLVMVFWGVSPVHGKTSSDDVAMIESLVAELNKAYNDREESALQLLWAQDGDLVTIPGDKIAVGQQAILQEIRENQNRDYKNGSIKLTISKIKFLGKDAALVEAINEWSGVTTPGGTVLPPIRHYVMMTVEKNKKAWFIDSVRFFSGLPIVRPLHSAK